MYGPTECTITATKFNCETNANYSRNVPIGSALPHTGCLVRAKGDICHPVSVPGELQLAGPKLARGYIARPDLTAKAFQYHDHQRLYATGDRVRWLLGGDLEFLGRVDFQIKLNGQRIEAGEIEAAARSAEGRPGSSGRPLPLRGRRPQRRGASRGVGARPAPAPPAAAAGGGAAARKGVECRVRCALLELRAVAKGVVGRATATRAATGQRPITIAVISAQTQSTRARVDQGAGRLPLGFAPEGQEISFDLDWLSAHAYDRADGGASRAPGAAADDRTPCATGLDARKGQHELIADGARAALDVRRSDPHEARNVAQDQPERPTHE